MKHQDGKGQYPSRKGGVYQGVVHGRGRDCLEVSNREGSKGKEEGKCGEGPDMDGPNSSPEIGGQKGAEMRLPDEVTENKKEGQ